MVFLGLNVCQSGSQYSTDVPKRSLVAVFYSTWHFQTDFKGTGPHGACYNINQDEPFVLVLPFSNQFLFCLPCNWNVQLLLIKSYHRVRERCLLCLCMSHSSVLPNRRHTQNHNCRSTGSDLLWWQWENLSFTLSKSKHVGEYVKPAFYCKSEKSRDTMLILTSLPMCLQYKCDLANIEKRDGLLKVFL